MFYTQAYGGYWEMYVIMISTTNVPYLCLKNVKGTFTQTISNTVTERQSEILLGAGYSVLPLVISVVRSIQIFSLSLSFHPNWIK